MSLTVQRLALRPYKHPPADSPVAPGEAPQPEELLSPVLAPESADATPPDAEVGVPDSGSAWP